MRCSPRMVRALAAAGGLVLLLTAVAGAAQDEPVHDVAGIYEIDGQTLVGETGNRFVMTGKLVVRQDGPSLSTFVEADVKRVEGNTGPASLSFISHGDAVLKGDRIAGVAEVQTIQGQVPGMDVSAPMMPRKAYPPFHATTAGKVVGEGRLRFEVRSDTQVFGPGGDRRTTFEAVRVARKATELKTKR